MHYLKVVLVLHQDYTARAMYQEKTNWLASNSTMARVTTVALSHRGFLEGYLWPMLHISGAAKSGLKRMAAQIAC